MWNIVKSKCKHNAVRVERGLIENTDVVLVRDMKLFVLTDKGMASFADPPRPIFQVPNIVQQILFAFQMLASNLRLVKKKSVFALFLTESRNMFYDVLDPVSLRSPEKEVHKEADRPLHHSLPK